MRLFFHVAFVLAARTDYRMHKPGAIRRLKKEFDSWTLS